MEKEEMMEVKHWHVTTNGISMHVAEQGDSGGAVVLLIHGFPELWFSWCHQMAGLARRGYRAIAPDLRGYGDSDAPPDPESYSIFHIVGDLVGLLDHLHQTQVFVVGHDWGANVAWHLCLFRPDRVRGLVNMGVPFFPRSPSIKPTDAFTNHFGDGLYILQFQEPGRAEKSFAHYNVRTVLKKFYSIKLPDLISPKGTEIIDFLETPSSLPPWINEEELSYFAEKFEKTGFTGPLNYYRTMDLNWKLLAPWQGARILVPTKFLVIEKDIGYQSYGVEDYVNSESFRSLVPNLDVVFIDGYHSIQQEKAERVTFEILTYFENLSVKESAGHHA